MIQSNTLTQINTLRDTASDFTPPSDIRAEQSVLAAVLIERAAMDAARAAGMTGADFYRPGHATLWGVIEDMAAQSVPIDLMTLRDELEKRGQFDAIGGTNYLLALMDTLPSAANAGYYAGIVAHHAVRRDICAAGRTLVALGQAESETAAEVIGEAERQVMAIADRRRRGAGSSETVGRLLYGQYERSEEMQARKGAMLGLSTGLPGLDRLTSGLQSPDFLVLAARPGAGKTSLLLHIALHIALSHHRPVILFSLEMSKEQYAGRIACMLAGLDSHRLRMGELSAEEWDRYSRAVQKCYDAPLIIDDTPGLTAADMASVLRRVRRERGDLAFAGVDYLQLMGTEKTENRTQAVSQLSRDLKQIARTENIPLLALSQLSRGVESRANKRPMLSDLRESGQIEADADLVAFLYNENYYARMENPALVVTEQTVDEVEFIVGKHRNGPTGIVKIGFQPTYTRFADISRRDDAPTGF